MQRNNLCTAPKQLGLAAAVLLSHSSMHSVTLATLPQEEATPSWASRRKPRRDAAPLDRGSLSLYYRELPSGKAFFVFLSPTSVNCHQCSLQSQPLHLARLTAVATTKVHNARHLFAAPVQGSSVFAPELKVTRGTRHPHTADRCPASSLLREPETRFTAEL